MYHKIFSTMIIAAAVAAAGSNASAQKKYSDIIAALPNLTLDQTYSELMEYQKSDPHMANTYLQLGIVSEKKMVLTDPLRNIDMAQYWANNANLFLGNFNVFYKEGDVRSNSDYYANLKIPAAGKKIEEAELQTFVEKHKRLCASFKDSTLLAYQAIEKSKGHYNNCITTFKAICDKYASLNEMLLRHDDELARTLDGLGQDIDKCVEAFAQFKAITKVYPILNYRQLYEFKTIETYRLDGLTNSDFYNNRFTMWDYRKWIDEVNKTMADDILPLRKKIEEINCEYVKAKAEYDGNKPLVAAAKPAYDDLFVFQLGKYDNNSLVRELFTYLEGRRKLIVMARDSLTMSTDTSAALINRKMRHIYRMTSMLTEAREALETFDKAIVPEKIQLFPTFFQNNYGGEQGLRGYSATEQTYLSKILGNTLQDFSTYMDNIDAQRRLPNYSIRKKQAAVPLWVVTEADLGTLKGNYVTKYVSYDAQGRPTYVAGTKKGVTDVAFVARINEMNNTAWITELRKTQAINSLSVNADGCIVAVSQSEQPVAIAFDGNGKEVRRFNINEGTPAFVNYNDITKRTYAAFNEGGGGTSLCLIDSLGAKTWDIALDKMQKIENMAEVSDGIVVTGQSNGQLVTQFVSDSGVAAAPTQLTAVGTKPTIVYRASAQDICLFSTDAANKIQMTIVSEKGEPKLKTAAQ